MFVLYFATATHADDKPVKHRVTGLSSPDRQDDLREVVKNNLPDVKLVSID